MNQQHKDLPPAMAQINMEQSFRLLSERLGPRWEPLATYLGLSSDRINIIKVENHETEEQIFNMLMMWKQENSSENITEQVLARALGCTGRRDLENEILQGNIQRAEEPSQSPSSTSGRNLTIPDVLTEGKLRRLSGHLGREWEQLATHLGVPFEQVGKIKRDHHGVEEKIFQMLIRWKQGGTRKDPLGCLVTALRETGRLDLADKLVFDDM